MAYLYVDTDGSGASAPYGTWATAAQDLKTALEAAASGDVIYVQGATKDSYTSNTTINPAGTNTDPIIVKAVANGTINEGANVTEADLVDRHTGTPTVIETTSTNNLTWSSAFVQFIGLEFSIGGSMSCNSDTYYSWSRCKFAVGVNGSGQITMVGNPAYCDIIDCEVSAYSLAGLSGRYFQLGGTLTTGSSWATSVTRGEFLLWGVDLSSGTSSKLVSGSSQFARATYIHCKLKPSMTLQNTSMPNPSQLTVAQMMNCSDNTAAIDSYQASEVQRSHGEIVQSSNYREGGASDQAAGPHSLAITTFTGNDGVLQYASPAAYTDWLAVWVEAGSNTLTVYTTHDDAGTLGRDLYESELRCEWLVPPTDDDAGYDYTLVAGLGVFDPSSTASAGDDDTTSSWKDSGGSAANDTYKRSFSHTFTAG